MVNIPGESLQILHLKTINLYLIMSITVVLNFYKRPHVIHEQLKAVREQSIPPTQIIIWRNFVEGYEFQKIFVRINQSLLWTVVVI